MGDMWGAQRAAKQASIIAVASRVRVRAWRASRLAKKGVRPGWGVRRKP